ncbi:MAG: hypothetical protein R3C13_11825 [Hyphomonas sp.]|uniref:hypothetical protein n=1 Tax=Hyphomonas sp. TaxID=87 RepID=UPI003527994B
MATNREPAEVKRALGAFTCGLNVLDEAFANGSLTAFALGEDKVFVLSGASLLGDVPSGVRWKL